MRNKNADKKKSVLSSLPTPASPPPSPPPPPPPNSFSSLSAKQRKSETKKKRKLESFEKNMKEFLTLNNPNKGQTKSNNLQKLISNTNSKDYKIPKKNISTPPSSPPRPSSLIPPPPSSSLSSPPYSSSPPPSYSPPPQSSYHPPPLSTPPPLSIHSPSSSLFSTPPSSNQPNNYMADNKDYNDFFQATPPPSPKFGGGNQNDGKRTKMKEQNIFGQDKKIKKKRRIFKSIK